MVKLIRRPRTFKMGLVVSLIAGALAGILWASLLAFQNVYPGNGPIVFIIALPIAIIAGSISGAVCGLVIGLPLLLKLSFEPVQLTLSAIVSATVASLAIVSWNLLYPGVWTWELAIGIVVLYSAGVVLAVHRANST